MEDNVYLALLFRMNKRVIVVGRHGSKQQAWLKNRVMSIHSHPLPQVWGAASMKAAAVKLPQTAPPSGSKCSDTSTYGGHCHPAHCSVLLLWWRYSVALMATAFEVGQCGLHPWWFFFYSPLSLTNPNPIVETRFWLQIISICFPWVGLINFKKAIFRVILPILFSFDMC